MSSNLFPNLGQRRGDLRVVTLNLWGRRGDWEARRALLSDGIHELRPALIAFQEAIVTDEYDQVVDLLGDDYHVIHQQDREPGEPDDVEPGQGFSVASRWPVGKVRELDLNVSPRTADFACGALVAEVFAPEPIGPLLLVYHNPSWKLNMEYEREQQAVITARFVEELVARRDRHVILVGDLDADPDAASARFWCGRQSLGGMSVCYRDTWESRHPDDPGHTFTPENPLMVDWDWPFRRIDCLFVRCGEHGGPTLAISACERIFDRPVDGVWASDHFGLVADLAVPDPLGL